MNAKVALISKTRQDSIRYAADAHLQRGAIGNKRGNIARDAHMHVAHRFDGEFEQRPAGLNNRGDVAYMDDIISVRAGHPLVDFSDNQLCASRRGEHAFNRGSQAHEAVLVGRRKLQQRHIDGQRAALDQVFNFAEEDGDVIDASGSHRLAHIGAHKQGAMAEMAFVLGVGIARKPQRAEVNNLYIAQLRGAVNQGIDQHRRRAAPRLNPHSIAGAHDLERLGRVHAFALKIIPPVQGCQPP